MRETLAQIPTPPETTWKWSSCSERIGQSQLCQTDKHDWNGKLPEIHQFWHAGQVLLQTALFEIAFLVGGGVLGSWSLKLGVVSKQNPSELLATKGNHQQVDNCLQIRLSLLAGTSRMASMGTQRYAVSPHRGIPYPVWIAGLGVRTPSCGGSMGHPLTFKPPNGYGSKSNHQKNGRF